MKKCINCGCNIINRNKYCSLECQKEDVYKKYIDNWKRNIVDGKRGQYQLSMHIKRYLFEKYNYQCSECGWNKVNPYTNKIPLEIEHIDGNYLNNREENLKVLCPNCHSLTSTYKGANMNSGRKARSKYKL